MKKRIITVMMIVTMLLIGSLPSYATTVKDSDGTLESISSGQGLNLTPIYDKNGSLIGNQTDSGDSILFTDVNKVNNDKKQKDKNVNAEWGHTGYHYDGYGGQAYGQKFYSDGYNYSYTTSSTKSLAISISTSTTASISVEAGFPDVFKAATGLEYSKNYSVTTSQSVELKPRTWCRLNYAADLAVYNWTDYNILSDDVSFKVNRPLGTYTTWLYTYNLM